MLKHFSQRWQHWETSKKLAAVSREAQEYPRSSQSRNKSALGITEEYIAEVSEEIEGRATKKLSEDFNRTETESRILGALSKLDEFLLNPLVKTSSWSGVLCLLYQQPNWVRPRRNLSHGDGSGIRTLASEDTATQCSALDHWPILPIVSARERTFWCPFLTD